MSINEKIRAIVVTVSDSRTENDDASGTMLIEMLSEIGAEIVEKIIVTDDLKICARRSTV